MHKKSPHAKYSVFVVRAQKMRNEKKYNKTASANFNSFSFDIWFFYFHLVHLVDVDLQCSVFSDLKSCGTVCNAALKCNFCFGNIKTKPKWNVSSHSVNTRVEYSAQRNSVKKYFARKNILRQESNNNIMHFYCLNWFLAVIAASIHSDCSIISALTQRQSLILYFIILYHTFQKIAFIAAIYGQRMARVKREKETRE